MAIIVQLQLQIQRGESGHWNSSFPLPLDELKGLSAAQLEAPQAEVRFELLRDAGTLAFEGRFQQGDGAGHFRFAPSAEYVESMRRMGYQGLDEEKVFSLAVHDVSRTLIHELAGLGYERVALDDLIKMRIHGASPELIRELKTLGYEKLAVDDLVKMRIHGVTADFIRGIQQKSGRAVSADRLVEMRIHGREP